jgi:predicted DNA-binding ribbon-helix-helix protein
MKKNMKKTVKTISKKLSVPAPCSTRIEIDYEKDFSKWAAKQAKFLKIGEFEKLDLANLIEEIEDLSKREKQRLTSYLEGLLMHKLKVKFQSAKHTKSWDLSIKEANHKAQKTLSENPSLKSKLKDIVEDAYFSARLKAAVETKLDESKFPEKCPWSLKDLFPDLEKKYC